MNLVVFPGSIQHDATPSVVTEERIAVVLALIDASRAAAESLLCDLGLTPGQAAEVGGYMVEGRQFQKPFIRRIEQAV